MHDIIELVLESYEKRVAEDLHDSEKWCFSAARCLVCVEYRHLVIWQLSRFLLMKL